MLWILNYGHHFDVLTDQRIIFSFVVLWHLTIVSRDLNHYVYFNLHAFNFHTYTKWTKKIFFVGFNKKRGKLTFFWLNSDGFCRVIAKYKSGFLKRVWSIYVFFSCIYTMNLHWPKILNFLYPTHLFEKVFCRITFTYLISIRIGTRKCTLQSNQ